MRMFLKLRWQRLIAIDRKALYYSSPDVVGEYLEIHPPTRL